MKCLVFTTTEDYSQELPRIIMQLYYFSLFSFSVMHILLLGFTSEVLSCDKATLSLRIVGRIPFLIKAVMYDVIVDWIEYSKHVRKSDHNL
jgi:hypothetical protein